MSNPVAIVTGSGGLHNAERPMAGRRDVALT
jgi:hypothetical protein